MFNFQFSLAEINVILGLLGKGPYDQVSQIIANIQQQAQPQLARIQSEEEASKAAG